MAAALKRIGYRLIHQLGILWCDCGRGFTLVEWVKQKGECDHCNRVYDLEKLRLG